ncbi:HAD family hydrolase [Kineosporiaceae bacterium SCSIO 59966]|nr:HAD family hydrolase [Kineosporiaceae bacterium SCSIO 59966]
MVAGPAPCQGDPVTDTVLLDVDGTLVDSTYHHVVAWRAAFAGVGVDVPAARIHRAVGMGGDRLPAAVAGDDVERDHGDALRQAWEARYDDLVDQVRPLPGASDLVRACAAAGLRVVLASSGKAKHLDAARRLLAVDEHLAGVTTSEDVDTSKPAGDVFAAALAAAGGSSGVVVGDTPWDARAAAAVGMRCVLLRSGGFCDTDLRAANPLELLDTPADLVPRVEELLR